MSHPPTFRTPPVSQMDDNQINQVSRETWSKGKEVNLVSTYPWLKRLFHLGRSQQMLWQPSQQSYRHSILSEATLHQRVMVGQKSSRTPKPISKEWQGGHAVRGAMWSEVRESSSIRKEPVHSRTSQTKSSSETRSNRSPHPCPLLRCNHPRLL